MKIIFWQYIQCQLQSSYIRSLAADGQHDVFLVTQDDMPGWRIDMGWKKPDYGNVTLIHKPDKITVNRLARENKNDTTHIFNSLGVYPMVHYAFKQCPENANIGIFSETHVWKGLKGPVRLVLGKYRAARYDYKINFILAVGTLGYKWFQLCGFPDNKIYPFGYFVEDSMNQTNYEIDYNNNDSLFRIGFTGQLIYRKGLDILIRALSDIKDLKWVLDVVGDGEKRSELQSLCEKLDIADRVYFHGAKANQDVVRAMKKLDLFVLPSRWDGWGAVTNEALMNGVPVICSDLCGSASLIRDDRIGEIFAANNTHSLRQALVKRISCGKRTKETANIITKWSKKIRGESAANYLMDIINASLSKSAKPSPPWV